MSLIRLTINRISYSQTHNGAYALLLNEKNGERKLPIVIGGFEAQSIAVALEREIRPPRPLTHDLFKSFSDCFEIKNGHSFPSIIKIFKKIDIWIKRKFRINLFIKFSTINTLVRKIFICYFLRTF